MQQIKNYYTVKKNQVIINLPKSFDNKRVEVIVLPVDNDSEAIILATQKSKEESLKRLHAISQWEEEDINNVINS